GAEKPLRVQHQSAADDQRPMRILHFLVHDSAIHRVSLGQADTRGDHPPSRRAAVASLRPAAGFAIMS
ncbi:MAG TPA: hypothetical protein VHY82_08330, partial [Acetobacteraceae bacterium]|nr:hypothetical protein [Acetobacteraceae bacterium]